MLDVFPPQGLTAGSVKDLDTDDLFGDLDEFLDCVEQMETEEALISSEISVMMEQTSLFSNLSKHRLK